MVWAIPDPLIHYLTLHHIFNRKIEKTELNNTLRKTGHYQASGAQHLVMKKGTYLFYGGVPAWISVLILLLLIVYLCWKATRARNPYNFTLSLLLCYQFEINKFFYSKKILCVISNNRCPNLSCGKGDNDIILYLC